MCRCVRSLCFAGQWQVDFEGANVVGGYIADRDAQRDCSHRNIEPLLHTIDSLTALAGAELHGIFHDPLDCTVEHFSVAIKSRSSHFQRGVSRRDAVVDLVGLKLDWLQRFRWLVLAPRTKKCRLIS